MSDPRALLLYHPCMKGIATSLLAALPSRLRASEVKWRRFPDNWIDVKFEHRSTMKNRDVVFLASFHDPAVVLEQASLMVAVARQGIKSFRVFVPWYGCGTCERVAEDPNEKVQDLATAETVLKMVTSCLPCTAGGPPSITIFDIHALVERFYANDRATVILESAIPLIKQKIVDAKMTVIFPDEGAFKRFGSLFLRTCPVVVCSKVRGEGDQRTIAITQEFLEHSYGEGIDPMTQPAIIIDDLVQLGGTLSTCAAALRAKYPFRSLSAYVTHAIFPGESFKQFLPGLGKHGSLFERFYVTNTNPTVSDVLVKVRGPFEVLDIAPLIAKSLQEDLKEWFKIATNLVEFLQLPEAQAERDVVLCSQSPVKKAAVASFLREKGFPSDVFVHGLKTKSGVPEQPIGREQIYEGAANRLVLYLLEYRPKTLVISIESGIDEISKGVWQERSMIIAVRGKEEPRLAWADGPVLTGKQPYDELLPQVLAAKGTITLGDLIHAKDPTIPADEWYPRVDILATKLTELLSSS